MFRQGWNESRFFRSTGFTSAVLKSTNRGQFSELSANEPCILNGQEVLVTASFGIAGFDGTGQPTLQELLTRADHALYSAKAFGRNQVRAEIRSLALDVVSPAVKP